MKEGLRAGPRPSLDRSPMVATGGVYKGQGRNRRRVMTGAYGEFLVYGAQWSSPDPEHGGDSAAFPTPFGPGRCPH